MFDLAIYEMTRMDEIFNRLWNTHSRIVDPQPVPAGALPSDIYCNLTIAKGFVGNCLPRELR